MGLAGKRARFLTGRDLQAPVPASRLRGFIRLAATRTRLRRDGLFISYLAYKAERAGGQLIRVKPHNTSNMCSRCSKLTKSTIGDDYRCAQCGHLIDRDLNAALNILSRGIVTPATMAA